MDDHFFNDLGANSLLMARFCAQIRERLNYSDVSMREVYLHPTPRDFASFLTTRPHRKPAAAQAEPVHVASNIAYCLCGALQLVILRPVLDSDHGRSCPRIRLGFRGERDR